MIEDISNEDLNKKKTKNKNAEKYVNFEFF
jgi:hypothetical protein